jgi:hypothetical protein
VNLFFAYTPNKERAWTGWEVPVQPSGIIKWSMVVLVVVSFCLAENVMCVLYTEKLERENLQRQNELAFFCLFFIHSCMHACMHAFVRSFVSNLDLFSHCATLFYNWTTGIRRYGQSSQQHQ